MREAPITATDAGSSTLRSRAAAAVRWRASNAAMAVGESEEGNCTMRAPRSARSSTGNPLPRNISIMRRLSAITSASSSSTPGGVGVLGEVGQQQGPEAAPLEGVGDGEGHLGHGSRRGPACTARAR